MRERGWDRFLTEGDRRHMSRDGVRKARPFGLGDRPALLVIDVYREALGYRDHPEDFESWPMSCGRTGWEAVDRIASLIERCRARAIRVIHVTGDPILHTRWGDGDDMARRLDFGIVPEVSPAADEVVIRKSSPSALQGTPLLFHLNQWDINTMIVCGEATSGCIRATVVDAATHRFRVAVVEDCCFDRTEASHWINLFDMNQKYADVITSDEAGSYLGGTAQKGEAGSIDDGSDP